MSDTNILWTIVAAIVAVVVVAGLILITRNRRTQKRRLEAEELRGELVTESHQVDKRQALAEETSAKARAAEAEAEVKAAEARRLRERAATHQDTVAADLEDLDDRRKHIDQLDPDVKIGKHEAATAHKGGDQLPDRQVITEPPRRVENPR